jgi:sigma-B regulation protein RsbQ
MFILGVVRGVSVLRRNNVHVRGIGERAMLFAHGFGCNQEVWRFVAPSFERDFVTVLFDYVGSGDSQLPAYSSLKYSTLEAYANDVVEIGRELELQHAIIVGHSCGAMIAAMASIIARDMFDRLIMIGPSPRYIDDDVYTGGFSASQINDMLILLDHDFATWASRMAPVFMGNPERPQLTEELIASFLRSDATVIRDFARVIFFSDIRKELPRVETKTLILQCHDDYVVPPTVAEYVQRSMPDSKLVMMEARGHFPHLSAPGDTIVAIDSFLSDLPRGWLKKTSRVMNVVRERSEVLGARNPIIADDDNRNPSDDILDALLARLGELWMHLGRYDMYALTLQELLLGKPVGAKESRFALHTRGEEIVRLLQPLSPELCAQFVQTKLELEAVLKRHEISARHGARIPGVPPISIEKSSMRTTQARSWFDLGSARTSDWLVLTETVERDILKIVSLCFRITDCALAVQRLRSSKAE